MIDVKLAEFTFINEDTGATLKDAAGNDAVRSLATNGTDGNGNAARSPPRCPRKSGRRALCFSPSRRRLLRPTSVPP